MANVGVRYQLSTGKLLGVYHVATEAELALNYDPASEGMVVVTPSEALEVLGHPDRWRAGSTGLIAKAAVTLTPSAATFQANGTEECQITATGIVGSCTVRGKLAAFDAPIVTRVLTAADPVLILTADTPQQFTIQVVDPAHWSDVLIVRAI